MSKRNSIDEKPLRSSGPDFDRFLNSAIWYDMQSLIKDRLELLQNQFVAATDMDEIRRIQGEMKAWKEMLGMPGYLKTCAHSEQDQTQEQTEIDYEE